MTRFLCSLYHEAVYAVVLIAMFFLLGCLILVVIDGTNLETLAPESVVDEFQQLCNENRYAQAYELVKADDSVVAQILTEGLSRLSVGHATASDAMDYVAATEDARLRRPLDYVRIIGVVGLIIGVFGGCHGTIAASGRVTDANADSRITEFSRGITKAVPSVMLGLVIAAASHSAHVVLSRRVDNTMLEVTSASKVVMSRFSGVSAQDAETNDN